MITAQELRLGNWMQETDTNGKIHYFQMNIDFLETLLAEPGLFDPIPLTPEILEKCGFEETDAIVSDGDEKTYWRHKIDYQLRFTEIGIEYNYEHLSHIKYLHQLQNLYFALTGEELEVKL